MAELLERIVALDLLREIYEVPKTELNELQLKALLTYLNSSFQQLYIESIGRTTGAVGPIGLEVKHAKEMPVPNIRKLNQKDLELLASLFDELEAEARKLGGADTRENLNKLAEKVINKIDLEIAMIIGLPEVPEKVQLLVKTMMERRLARAEEARPDAIRGEEIPRIKPPKKTGRESSKEDELTQPLERWIR